VVDKQELDYEWMEPVLTRNLRRVGAPRELWHRVDNPVSSAKGSDWRLRLALAATLAIVTIAWGFYQRLGSLPASQALAIRSLSRGTDLLEFRSSESAQIRAWVKTSAGIDVPLPSATPATVQMLGAHVVKGPVSGVEVAYRLGRQDVVLVVSKAGSMPDRVISHRFLASKDDRLSSWIMGGNLYTLACANPGDIRVACVLCHFVGDGQAALN
jgi:hypothetical protein